MNFHNTLKLYRVSKEYFWTFMEVCAPLVKIGIRKGLMMTESSKKILAQLREEALEKPLTQKEHMVAKSFALFIEDSFTDGNSCFTLKQLKSLPFKDGCTNSDKLVATTYDSLKTYIDSIKYLTIGDDKFFKTCPALFLLEKYHGDLNVKEVLHMTVPAVLEVVQGDI